MNVRSTNRSRQRTIARFFLIASAFVLAGLLIMTLQQRGGWDTSAHGELLIEKDGLTVMTAQTRSDEEAVFLLDSVNERLLIYTLRILGTGGRLELAKQVDLPGLFDS